ncbi:MAG: F0F1 ATP synthase subunit delta [Furfurilactobacillus sp.]|jgi:F-type H+-transporting ATPase subunit delta|uniref:ATP synthase subunit delta n=3 Tax=Furfurilactobacillus TaxID=2767882 RepID=A0A0R1RCT8_9LACO|nr:MULTISPECIES: ATP synthase F1 subunit delta [Furfurilactobacillus]KRL54222.1 F0F1 ATP synthase subunit delta [Furfurilactobacillus rossiae DSM 15814]MCF6166406.1 F0F1 ATP synthase subunit delta [Furfurilactobacillus rossiae]MCF6419012.1 F0F1 ATP synthase subunit delta [Furfurilactobacillus milii]MCH4011176.1 F0F1 ATP synthase subunit delta [Furfurilactobacillus sp.]MCH4037068.1 F0F1 ATP synthase subunit delta [Furfurilactobacillus sp.]
MTKLAKSQVARRYGRAMFDAANEKQQLEPVYDELIQVQGVFQSVPNLGTVLTGAGLQNPEKEALLKPLLSSTSPLVHNFLQMLFDYGRLDDTVAIIDEFKRLYDEQNQTVYADVTTAVSLDETQKQRLADSIAKRVGAKTVHVNQIVNPDIIGGVIVNSNNTVIDGSIRTRLAHIRQSLTR